MEVVNKELSNELDLSIKFENGKAVLELKYGGSGGAVALVGELDAEYFVGKVAKAIPGEIDDMILKGLMAAVK